MLSPQLGSTLAARYGLESIHAARALEGGEWKQLWQLESDKGCFVLSISHQTTVVAGIAFEHDLLNYLHRHFAEIPLPLPGHDGTTYFTHNDRVATLFPFMPGAIADDRLESVRLEAARMLARLHRAFLSYPSPPTRPGICALRDLDWNHNPWWNWPEVYSLLMLDDVTSHGAAQRFWQDGLPFTRDIIKRKAQIEQEQEALSSFIQDLTSSGISLLFAPTHGDYYARNLLIQNNRVSAILDWDECRPDWLAFELARAILSFCSDGDAGALSVGEKLDTFRARATSFLQAYQAEGGPVPQGEFSLLALFMRCACLIDTLFAFGAFLKGEVWNATHAEYHLNNLISMESLKAVELALC